MVAISLVLDGARVTPDGTSRGGITVRAAPESGRATKPNLVPDFGTEQAREILLRVVDDVTYAIVLILTVEGLLALRLLPTYCGLEVEECLP